MLMTAAPCAIARLIPVTESAQRISSGSGTLSARMPGQTPVMPTSFFGAAATAAVSVPWAEATGSPPSVATLPPANSGWAASSWESTSASSGLAGVTGGGTSAGSTIAARHAERRVERVGRRGLHAAGEPVGLGVEQQPAAAQRPGERTRAGPRDDIGARADPARAVGGGERVGGAARLRPDDPGRAVRAHRGRGGVAGERHGRAQRRGGRAGGGEGGAAHDGGEEEAAVHPSHCRRREPAMTRARALRRPAPRARQSASSRSAAPVRTARSSAGAAR